MAGPKFAIAAACALALFAVAQARGQAGSAPRPNVVVVLADDQGWGDLSIHGNTNLSTPNIDSLARDGALGERFFVCPVCSPTRAEFFTGRYNARGGVRGVSTGGERLDLDERTIGDAFKAAGYATGAFGKWHNGTQSPYHPNDRGFDEYYGFTSGHWGMYFDPELDHNGRMVRGKGFIVDDLTDHALRFIEQNRRRPFFCYLPLNTPHSPMQVPDRFYEKFRNAELKLRAGDPQAEDVPKTRAALAMCENIDWNVGRVLRRLDELKLAEKTIVVYFSDNGPNGARWNGGMKGVKGSLDEGGVRSPLLIRWPGQIKAGTRIPQIAGAVDLLPTLADLAGIRVPASKPLDGKSLKPLLLGQAGDWPDRTLVTYWNGRVSLRTQRYRLDPAGRLYDMVADPGQQRDVAAERKEDAARLSGEAARWKAELQAELGQEDRPFTAGYSRTTPLPARDGVPHGGVKRSASAPNCSFFTGWSSPDDRITWEIEVAESGRYAVDLHYTCPAADVGSTIEVSCGEHRLTGKVTEAHDPPLRGAEHDRVPRRGESYVKDFKPLRLGALKLERGRGHLTLRALEVPGRQVMDVRYVVLTRLDG
jgi:arylsulfatase A-like enzyme